MITQAKVNYGRFDALVASWGLRKSLEAEVIGQLAIHPSIIVNAMPHPTAYSLSHAGSGYAVWHFEEWVSLDELRRLAQMLAGQDFDAYARDSYQDKAFVAECKRIEQEWEATYPDRLAHDRMLVEWLAS